VQIFNQNTHIPYLFHHTKGVNTEVSSLFSLPVMILRVFLVTIAENTMISAFLLTINEKMYFCEKSNCISFEFLVKIIF
jgi:hypothetical protein